MDNPLGVVIARDSRCLLPSFVFVLAFLAILSTCGSALAGGYEFGQTNADNTWTVRDRIHTVNGSDGLRVYTRNAGELWGTVTGGLHMKTCKANNHSSTFPTARYMGSGNSSPRHIAETMPDGQTFHFYAREDGDGNDHYWTIWYEKW